MLFLLISFTCTRLVGEMASSSWMRKGDDDSNLQIIGHAVIMMLWFFDTEMAPLPAAWTWERSIILSGPASGWSGY